MAAYQLRFNPDGAIQMPTLFLAAQQARLLGSMDENDFAE